MSETSMFEPDEVATEAVLAYARARLAESPVPLDFGSLVEVDEGALAKMIGEGGRSPDAVLEYFARELAPAVISSDAANYLAFIPNAPTKASMLFDVVVASSGLNGSSWLESRGAVAAENAVLRFLAAQAGLPAEAGGVFVAGGSMANLSALTVGRDVGRARRALSSGGRFAVSADAHSSVGRALHVLGVEALVVPCSDHRFSAEDLAAALERDGDPSDLLGVIATCGTTNAGIIDDLEGLGALCRERGWWFHVDGAYGAAAMFSQKSELTKGLRHVDSFIIDPHKWLFAPLDCAAVIYRSPALARRVHTQEAGYLDVLHEGEEDREWNPSDYALHLSRRARGLPLWFSLVTNGVASYRRAIDASIDLTQRCARAIEERDYLELLREPELSIVLFRRVGWGPEDYRAWSQRLLLEQLAFVTPTKWEGETVARLAFLHPDTSPELVGQILESMR